MQGDLRLHHYAVRSYEDAVIKASIWNKTESMDIWQYAVRPWRIPDVSALGSVTLSACTGHSWRPPNVLDAMRVPIMLQAPSSIVMPSVTTLTRPA